MTDKNGWILLHRKIYKNWVWDDKPFSKGQAWIDMMLMVNHTAKKILFNKELVEVKRGQRVTSEVKLAERWGWSRTKVRNFLGMLEKDEMIKVDKKNKRRTMFEVLNYNDYQTLEDDKKQQKNNRKTTEKQQKNTNNELELMKKNEKEEVMASASSTERKILKTIKSIPQYPFGYEDDIEYIRELMTDYPEIDILEEAKKWKTYKKDKPLKKNSNARLQLRNWMSNASKWSNNNQNSKSEKEKIEKRKKEQLKRAEKYG